MFLFLVLVMDTSLILFLPKIDFLPPWSPGGFLFTLQLVNFRICQGFFFQVIVDYYTFKVYTVCMDFKFFGGAFMPADSVRINFWIPKDNLELVDAACRRWGVNRTAFINFACMNFLRQEELYYTDNFSAAMMAASQMDEKGVMLIDKFSDKLSDKSKGSGD
jgi:hypothetical protein